MKEDTIGKILKISIVVLVLITAGLIGILFIPEVRTRIPIKQLQTKKHDDDDGKMILVNDENLGSLIITIKAANPKEGWSTYYDDDKSSPQYGKIVLLVDAESEELTYKQKVKEAFVFYQEQGFEPCKEPLLSVLSIQIINPPTTSWEPCP